MSQPTESIDQPVIITLSIHEITRLQDRQAEAFAKKPELRLIREVYECAKAFVGQRRLGEVSHNIGNALVDQTHADPYVCMELPRGYGQIVATTRYVDGARRYFDLRISGAVSQQLFVTEECFDHGLRVMYDQVAIQLELLEALR